MLLVLYIHLNVMDGFMTHCSPVAGTDWTEWQASVCRYMSHEWKTAMKCIVRNKCSMIADGCI